MVFVIMVISCLWIAAVSVFEWRRDKAFYPVDFTTLVNVLFLLNYAVPPIAQALIPAYGQGLMALFNGSFKPEAFSLQASLLALCGHCLFLGVRSTLVPKLASGGPAFSSWAALLTYRDKAVLTILSLLIGLSAYYYYAQSLGGFQKMWDMSFHLRAGYETASFGFLKIIAFVLVPAFYLTLAQAVDSTGKARWLWGGIAMVVLAAAFTVLFHDGSRLFLIVMVATVFLSWVAMKQRVPVGRIIVAAICVVLFYSVGDPLFEIIILGYDWSTLGPAQPIQRIFTFLAEFGFPYPVLATYLSLVPETIAYRGVTDLVNGIILLLPSVLIDQDPTYIFDINREVLDAEVPIDLMSFGLVASGLFGAILAISLFALLISFLDALFIDARDFFSVIIRSALVLQVPWFVMYGDPVNMVKRVFAMSVVLAIIIVFMTWRRVQQARSNAGT